MTRNISLIFRYTKDAAIDILQRIACSISDLPYRSRKGINDSVKSPRHFGIGHALQVLHIVGGLFLSGPETPGGSEWCHSLVAYFVVITARVICHLRPLVTYRLLFQSPLTAVVHGFRAKEFFSWRLSGCAAPALPI
ncbi:MAG: hypothetical protein MJA29_10780, partial [Candidatus Omnitrophica bacterium]|nr:hypothetical protein [Candidatus Omnitrophota bacterium]